MPADGRTLIELEMRSDFVRRHIGPGDVLTATTKPGETWEKQSKRAGKLTFTETIQEYRNQKGELVVTSRGVGVKTERPVDQG